MPNANGKIDLFRSPDFSLFELLLLVGPRSLMNAPHEAVFSISFAA